VKVNGNTIPQAQLKNNLYYEIEGNQPMNIESDKPVNVTQFILAGGCQPAFQGNGGSGDPEMIILSPIQQAITNVTVYSANIKRSGATTNGNYINVIIKDEGIPSFKIDGIDYNSTTRVDTGVSSYQNSPYGSSLVFLKDAFK